MPDEPHWFTALVADTLREHPEVAEASSVETGELLPISLGQHQYTQTELAQAAVALVASLRLVPPEEGGGA